MNHICVVVLVLSLAAAPAFAHEGRVVGVADDTGRKTARGIEDNGLKKGTDINYFPENQPVHKYAEYMMSFKTDCVVAGHGNNSGVHSPAGLIPARVLAADINAAPGCAGSTAVKLAACEVGQAKGYMEEVAKLTHKKVCGPTTFFWYSPDGRVGAYGNVPNANRVYVWFAPYLQPVYDAFLDQTLGSTSYITLAAPNTNITNTHIKDFSRLGEWACVEPK